MENKRFGNLGEYAKESAHKEYVYSRLPENIRQIGETNGNLRIYIEDYVMTYIHQIFNEKQEKAIVIFLGKKGKEQASGCMFIYGALFVQCDMMEGPKELTANKWNQVYKDMHDNFPGAQMLGWGCGVSMWNSRADVAVRQIHGKYFSEEGKVLFVTDISEKEEKIFLWNDGDLYEQPGFVVYYEKNPQMQEYMLKSKEPESIEAQYQDNVTANMRNVIKEKEDKKPVDTKKISYAAVAVMSIMLLFAAGILYRSIDRIKSLEKTLNSVEGYINNNIAQPVMADKSTVFEDGTASKNKETNKKNKNVLLENSTKSDKSSKTSTPKNTDSPESQEPASTSNPVSESISSSVKPSKNSKNTSSKKNNNSKETIKYKGKYESYIVNAGDTLSQIVWKQYHSFYYLDKVMKANNIKDSDKIYEGDCIILPDFS